MIDFTRPDPLKFSTLKDKRDMQIKNATKRLRKILDCDRRYLAECADLGFLEGGSVEAVEDFYICSAVLAKFYSDLSENAKIALESVEYLERVRRKAG